MSVVGSVKKSQIAIDDLTKIVKQQKATSRSKSRQIKPSQQMKQKISGDNQNIDFSYLLKESEQQQSLIKTMPDNLFNILAEYFNFNEIQKLVFQLEDNKEDITTFLTQVQVLIQNNQDLSKEKIAQLIKERVDSSQKSQILNISQNIRLQQQQQQQNNNPIASSKTPILKQQKIVKTLSKLRMQTNLLSRQNKFLIAQIISNNASEQMHVNQGVLISQQGILLKQIESRVNQIQYQAMEQTDQFKQNKTYSLKEMDRKIDEALSQAGEVNLSKFQAQLDSMERLIYANADERVQRAQQNNTVRTTTMIEDLEHKIIQCNNDMEQNKVELFQAMEILKNQNGLKFDNIQDQFNDSDTKDIDTQATIVDLQNALKKVDHNLKSIEKTEARILEENEQIKGNAKGKLNFAQQIQDLENKFVKFYDQYVEQTKTINGTFTAHQEELKEIQQNLENHQQNLVDHSNLIINTAQETAAKCNFITETKFQELQTKLTTVTENMKTDQQLTNREMQETGLTRWTHLQGFQSATERELKDKTAQLAAIKTNLEHDAKETKRIEAMMQQLRKYDGSITQGPLIGILEAQAVLQPVHGKIRGIPEESGKSVHQVQLEQRADFRGNKDAASAERKRPAESLRHLEAYRRAVHETVADEQLNSGAIPENLVATRPIRQKQRPQPGQLHAAVLGVLRQADEREHQPELRAAENAERLRGKHCGTEQVPRERLRADHRDQQVDAEVRRCATAVLQHLQPADDQGTELLEEHGSTAGAARETDAGDGVDQVPAPRLRCRLREGKG